MAFKYDLASMESKVQMPEGWVGFDLDGTIAQYTTFQGWDKIGPPVPGFVNLIKKLRALGVQCKILTARASAESRALNDITFEQVEKVIQDWTEKYIGERLPVVTEKGAAMICFFDDSAIQVDKNTGNLTAGSRGLEPFEEKLIQAIKAKQGVEQ